MTTPSAPEGGQSGDGGAHSSDPTADAPFDPYRFGLPDHPVPPEYAPPGYVPPPPVTPAPSNPWGPPVQLPPSYGSAQYPPHGAPPPPVYHSYEQPKPGSGKAIAALVLGIASIVMFWTSILDGILVILAVVFGIMGLNEANARRTGGRGMALAGLICAAVGAAAAIAFTVWVVHAVNACGGFASNNSSGFNHCVQDHL